MLVPSTPEFKWKLQTTTGRIAASYGVTVTPGNNTMGSWAELIDGALVTEDVYGIALFMNSGNTSSTLRDIILDVGIDESAGTSYVVKIPYLLCSATPTNAQMPGVVYYFPLFIKSGSSIAVRASVNNATVGSMRCFAKLFGKPGAMEVTRTGSFVRSFGQDTANSRGTAITAGTTSEGSWTQLGSATADILWYWKLGMGIADATLGGVVYTADLAYGDASNKILILEDQIITANAAEYISWNNVDAECYCTVPSGANIYGRIQCSGTADTTLSLIAYGLGG